MKHPGFNQFKRAITAVKLGRLVVVGVAAVALGLGCDWLRCEDRLIFPRPLPALKITEPSR
jgi:hypothetical protein